MLAIRRLATSKLAVKSAKDEFAPVDYEGDLCILNQTVANLYGGDVAVFIQTVTDTVDYDGDLCAVAQSLSTNYEGFLANVSQRVSKAVVTLQFNDNVAFDNFGAFDLRIVCDGSVIDVCDYMQNIEVTFEEDKAALAKMVFKQAAGEKVDLHKYLNKPMRIELLRENKEPYVLYDGLFDASNWQFNQFFIEWNATAARERLFESMTDTQIRSIGVFDENVFKSLKDYTDKKTLVADRLSTIPASIDFINGSPIVTSWFPKATADYTLEACAILRDGAANNVLSQENIINKVTVSVQNQWDLLYYAKRKYTFDSEYTVCNYSSWGLPPMNSTVKSAADGTGWVLSDYTSTGLHAGGVYMCSWRGGFPQQMMWRPKSASFNKTIDADGNEIKLNEDEFYDRTVTDYTNVYAQTASFNLSTEWAQPIEETIDIVVQNSASIARYGERVDGINVNVLQDRSKSTNRVIKYWGDKNKYRSADKSGATLQPNGYWTLRADNIDKGSLQSAINVAKRAAEVIILSSHRSIEMTLKSKKFAPQFNVTQTHNVNFQHVNGTFKVARIVHNIDLIRKSATTEVTYKIFSNSENKQYEVTQVEPPRANLNMFKNPTYNGVLGVHNIGLGAKVFNSEDEFEDYKESGGMPTALYFHAPHFFYYNANGWITETYGEDRGLEFRREVEFQVIADEIEEESTETMEIKISKTFEMGIPNNNQDLTA